LVIDYKLMVIDYSFVNQFEKQCWLQVIDYYLLVIDYQRVKFFGKRFCEKFLCYSMFWKKSLVLLLILESWVLNLDLDCSWILIRETWLFLNLDSLKLDSWSLILEAFWLLILWNLLNSWFFGSIKIILEVIASTISPFLMMTILKSRGYIQVLFYRSLISFSPFLFEFMLNFKTLKI